MPLSFPPGNCSIFAPVTASQQYNPSSPAGKYTFPSATAGAPSVWLAVLMGLNTSLPSDTFAQNSRQFLSSCSPSPQYTRPPATVGVQYTLSIPGASIEN